MDAITVFFLYPASTNRYIQIQHSPTALLKLAGARSCSTPSLPGWGWPVQAITAFSQSLAKANRHAQTRHFLTISLKPMGACSQGIFQLSAEVSECAPTLTLSSSNHQSHGCTLFTQGMSHDCLALVGKEVCIPRLHRTETIRKTVLGRLPIPGPCRESTLIHTPSLPMIKAYLLVLEFWPERQASGLLQIFATHHP